MKKRRWIEVLLTIWPYFIVGVLWILAKKEDVYLGPVVTLLCVATVVVYVMNIVHACKCKNKDIRGLALSDMVIKLLHIPFYLIIAVVGLLMLVLMVVPVFVFISPAIVVMLAIIDYFLLLTTSAYGINALIGARKKGIISQSFMVINILMHLCFVLDIISAIIVFVKLRKANGESDEK